MIPQPAYRYRAAALRIIDGDTFIARVDLGFRVAIECELRIADVYSPELRDVGGLEARSFLVDLVGGQPLVVETRKTTSGADARSFTRYVADVALPDGRDVAAAIIAAGHGTAETTP